MRLSSPFGGRLWSFGDSLGDSGALGDAPAVVAERPRGAVPRDRRVPGRNAADKAL